MGSKSSSMAAPINVDEEISTSSSKVNSASNADEFAIDFELADAEKLGQKIDDQMIDGNILKNIDFRHFQFN
jgi:hypothetical protein